MNLEKIYYENYQTIYKYLKKKKWKYIEEGDIDYIINKSFYEFFKKKEKLYNGCKIEKYIQGFSFNIMRNLSTHKTRYYNKNIELSKYYYNIKNNNDLLDIIIKKERNQKIYDAISILNTKEKEIILLFYFYHYNYKEIKYIMNISSSTIWYIKKTV